MKLLNTALGHIIQTAQIPSFSSFEERIHPYICQYMGFLSEVYPVKVGGNNLIFKIPGNGNSGRTVALAAHLDKINHYGPSYPGKLPVEKNETHIEGAMDDCAGLGILLALAEVAHARSFPDLLFFFSEMEESKGIKEHPELLKNNGEGYESGMGAKQIAQTCIRQKLVPDEVITIDTTPLFKGKSGVALYSRYWEYDNINPSPELLVQTETVVHNILSIDPAIKRSNNTNDYMHYGRVFNETGDHAVVSVALEPAIYPYHQKKERVFIDDIRQVLNILVRYLDSG